MHPETATHEESFNLAGGLCDELGAHLAECDGIEVLDSTLRSEEDISLKDLRELVRWDFDFLSAAEDDLDDLAPNIDG